MAWAIHTWSAAERGGTIRSPHFGPIPFDESANIDNVDDFREGESVLVELEGSAPTFLVRTVVPMNQRQPPGTHWPTFDAINGRFGDVRIEELSGRSLQFWLGDCCEYCTPDPIRVRFEGVAMIDGLGDDLEMSDPLFRLASSSEVRDHGLVVPDDARAFCVVTSHGQGHDGPPIFVVAREARVVEPANAVKAPLP